MKNNEMENVLLQMTKPELEYIIEHRDLKIPFFSYKKSSRAGLWLLLLPITVAITILLKMELGMQTGYIEIVHRFFSFIDNNAALTYLIPLIFAGLPLLSMTVNLLAICHFQQNLKARELIITIKYRAFNIVVFLLSFSVLIFFLLPDMLAF